MKNFKELTEKELVRLTAKQVEGYIKLESAKKGIMLLNEPVPPTYNAVPHGDRIVFSTGILGDRIVFETNEDAQQVVELLKELKAKSITGDYNFSETKYHLQEAKSDSYRIDKYDISSREVYSASKYIEIKEILNSNSILKKDYDAEMIEYGEYLLDSDGIRNDINAKVDSATRNFNRMFKLCRLYKNEYLPLSDNNEKVAMKFLTKAYSLSLEEKSYVLANHNKIISTK